MSEIALVGIRGVGRNGSDSCEYSYGQSPVSSIFLAGITSTDVPDIEHD
jgi:hypothetical protein